jgi:arginine N-succinyltransferase
MLPPAAQAVVGEVHDETRPALKLLEQEGFSFAEQVDIFDAGPMLVAPRTAIRAVRESRVMPLIGVQSEPIEGPPSLVANERLDFRCGLGPVRAVGEGVMLARDLALALGLRLGDAVRFVEARAPTPE